MISVRTLHRIVWLFVPLLALRAPAAAQESKAENSDRWNISAEMSYTDQSGNKTLRLLTGGLRVSHREKEAFELDGSLQSRYGMSDDEVVARNDFGSLSVDLHPNDRWSPFLFVTAERDPFKRLDLRASGGAGAKYTLYQAEQGPGEASASLALLYSYENLAPSERDPLAPVRSLARWSLRARGTRELRSGVTLQHLSYYQPQWAEMADYLLRSETGVKVLLTQRLALSVSYQLDRNGQPPEGVAADDRLFKTGLIIEL
jgi:hypothetical protein